MKKVIIHTDGACSGNPGPGGYGIVMIYKETETHFSGYDPFTTNNKMELLAVIEALKKLKQSCEVEIFTDSKYVQQGITTWLDNWIKNNFKNSSKKDIANIDLWKEYIEVSKPHKITVEWVKGHNGDYYNEICDKLATEAVKRQ